LKKGLTTDPIPWIGDSSPLPDEQPAVTPHGVDPRIQEQLSAVRTDLDSFHDTEAAALMLSGYRMTDKYFAAAVPHFTSEGDLDRESWRFLQVGAALSGPPGQIEPQNGLKRLLTVSKHRAFKVLRLSPLLSWSSVAALAFLLVAMGWRAGRLGLDLKESAIGAASVLIGVVLLALIARLCRFPKSVSQFLSGLALVPGSALAWLHLWLFDPLYLALGQLGPDAAGARAKARVRMILIIILLVVAAVEIATSERAGPGETTKPAKPRRTTAATSLS
jgi:NTE family protein